MSTHPLSSKKSVLNLATSVALSVLLICALPVSAHALFGKDKANSPAAEPTTAPAAETAPANPSGTGTLLDFQKQLDTAIQDRASQDRANGETPTSKNKANAVGPTAPEEGSSETRSAFQAPKHEPVVIDPQLLAGLPTATQVQLKNTFESLNRNHRGVANDLRDEQEQSLGDVAMLWQAAAERSGSIRYALEKLSRRDATGKPVKDDGFTKRMLQSVVRLGGVAGSMVTGSPAGLISGSVADDLLRDDPNEMRVAMAQQVSDADMLILAKEIESLQNQVLEAYFAYRNSHDRLKISKEASSTIGKYFDHTKDLRTDDVQGRALETLLQSLYDSVRLEENTSQQDFLSTRNALGLLVGPEALGALDQSLGK